MAEPSPGRTRTTLSPRAIPHNLEDSLLPSKQCTPPGVCFRAGLLLFPPCSRTRSSRAGRPAKLAWAKFFYYDCTASTTISEYRASTSLQRQHSGAAGASLNHQPFPSVLEVLTCSFDRTRFSSDLEPVQSHRLALLTPRQKLLAGYLNHERQPALPWFGQGTLMWLHTPYTKSSPTLVSAQAVAHQLVGVGKF